jgi:hypothetical protein
LFAYLIFPNTLYQVQFFSYLIIFMFKAASF